MKRYFAIFTLLILSMVGAELSAQQLVKKRIGMYKENGKVVLSEAQTSLVVDLVVEEEHFVSGPYARYASTILLSETIIVALSRYFITVSSTLSPVRISWLFSLLMVFGAPLFLLSNIYIPLGIVVLPVTGAKASM